MFLEKFPYRVKFYTKSAAQLRRGPKGVRVDGAFGPKGCVEGL